MAPLLARGTQTHAIMELEKQINCNSSSPKQIICNSSSPSLVDIACFLLVTYCRQLHSFKTSILERGFHILIRNTSFLSPTDVEFNNRSSLRAQRSCCPMSGSHTICNSPGPLLVDMFALAHYVSSSASRF